MATETLAPELSSMSSSLQDVVRRVTAMAEGAAGTNEDWVAQELYEAERAIAEAVRRLDALSRSLRR